ncbi:MAG: iron-sulfur cluster assembly scaffold protein [Pirellulaceae bacterium]|nr:MAG: iron-sulfur cluster assembly scaffold protein [Pirellulaceae bacterium]
MEIPTLLRQHFEDPYHRGTCEHPTHSAEKHCPESGCVISMDVLLDAATNACQEAWFDGQGCEVCEGIASMLVEDLERRPEALAEWAAAIEGLNDPPRSVSRRASLLRRLGLSDLDGLPQVPCIDLPFLVLGAIVQQAADDDPLAWPHFGGPSLGEEV